jgi:type I restriction enzyme S subunit
MNRQTPTEWQIVRFGDIAENININEKNPLENGLDRFIGLEHLDPDILKIKRWGLIKDGTTFTKKFVKGQLLFGKRRSYQHKAALADFDGLCSGDILVFDVKNDRLIPDLLPFMVQTENFFDHAIKTSGGSLSPRTKWKYLSEYEIPLPPAHEQKRISDILWAVEECIRKWEESLEKAKVYKKVLMKHLFNYISLEKRQNISLFKSELDAKKWKTVYLKDIFELTSGKTRPENLSVMPNDESIYPVYGGNGVIGYSSVFFIDYKTIVLGRVGEYCGCVHIANNKCWITDNALYVRNLLNREIDRLYLAFALKALKLNNLKNQSAQPLISQSIVYSQKIPLPPLEEQQKIAHILFTLDKTIETAETHRKTLQSLKTRLLNDLLSGKKRLH